MDVLQIFLVTLFSSLRVFFTALLGTAFTRAQILRQDTKQDLSRMVFYGLSPIFNLVYVGRTANLTLLSASWPVPFFAVFQLLVAVLIAYLLVKVLRIRAYKFTLIAIIIASNAGGLPLAVLQSLCESDNAISSPYADSDDCFGEAVSYVGIYLLIANFVIFVVAFQLIIYDKELDSQGDGMQLEDMEESLELSPRVKQQQNSYFENKSWKDYARALFPPPILSIIVAYFLGSLPYVQSFLFDENATFSPLILMLESIGNMMIPISLFVLGSQLSNGPNIDRIDHKPIAAVCISRLLIMPLVTLGFFSLLDYVGAFTTSLSPLVRFIILIEGATPSAMSLNLIAQITGFARNDISSMLFYQYMTSLVTMTVWVAIFLWVSEHK